MALYRVRFFKTLLSSDGHPFKCLQQIIEVHRAKDADRAVKAAQRRYERLKRVRDWKLHADLIETESVEKGLDRQSATRCQPYA